MDGQHELIIPNEGVPFKVFLFEGMDGNYVRENHWHTSVEIFAVLEGAVTFQVSEKEYLLEKENLLIINSNEVHSIQAPRPNRTVVLQIPRTQFEGYFTAEDFIWFEREGESEDLPMIRKLGKLYRICEERGTGWEFEAMSVYYQILYLMVSVYRSADLAGERLRRSRKLDDLSRITSYMREHFREDLKLSSLAETFGYSDAYLSRMFRKYAHVNYKSYLQDIRVAFARRELLSTDHTIGEIAMNNGFASSRGFAKDFRKRYGILPSEMQKNKKVKKKPQNRQENW